MKNADIAKIRQLLKTVRKMVQCPHGSHVDKCDFCKRTRLLDEALALLPCPTCNGHKWTKGEPCPTCNGTKMINITSDMDFCTQWALRRFPEPCPDCQPKSCVCCEEITEENAHLHRNCGK